MTFYEIKQLVRAEYDKRQLASNKRYKALDKIEGMLKDTYPELITDVSKFPCQKETMKEMYENFRNQTDCTTSCGESSAINEIYNQLQFMGIHLTE